MNAQRIDTSQLQAPIRMVAGNPETEDAGGPPEGDFLDLSWVWPAAAVGLTFCAIAVGILVAAVLWGLS